MKKLMLVLSALLVAGSARATVPDWMRDSDAANLVGKAKAHAAKMKADATIVAAPQGLIQLSAGESGHLLELARRVVERGDVTLMGKVGDSDKYDAYACEDAGTHLIAAVAKAQTCTKAFSSSVAERVVALEVLVDVHSDGSRSIKGIKIFSGSTFGHASTVDMDSGNGIWIPAGRGIAYESSKQLTSDGQKDIDENLDVWGRMTVGMMGLDDECYYANGGTCG